MIIFRKDWLKYPNAIIHYKTKNVSFLKLAEIYYNMGIKNNAFHLSLLQPELEEIDPGDESLPLEIKAKIIYECKVNPWYFFREVLKVPVPGELKPSHFLANRANIGLYWLFFNHITTLLVIPRQTGKTMLISSLVTYLLNFGSVNTFINLLTKSETLKSETLAKVKLLFEELPSYLNMSTKKDIFNSDEIRLKQFNNVFKGNLSSPSPKEAEKVGRGFTSPINIIDECAYVSNIAIAMGAMLMTGNAAREIARKNNRPYGTILATTAGDPEDRDGKYIYSLTQNATIWNEIFFDAEDEEHLNTLIIKNNTSDTDDKRAMVYMELSYRQLGYDDDWLKRQLESNISTPENIERDIFNKWVFGSSASPIPKEYLVILRENIIETPRSEFYHPYNYLINWYISEEEVETRIAKNVNFIIGIDTSDAVGRDDTAFVVRDHTTGEVIATATFNEVNLITLSDFFVNFLLKYPNSIMVIERRSSASGIIDYMIQKLLANNINPFTRLYNSLIQNKENYKEEIEFILKARLYNIDIFEKYKKYIGFTTSGSGITSRNELYSSTLINMLKYTAHCTYDRKLISQLSSLIVKNNRIDHPDGGKDDLVIASLLSYWLLINGKNLNYYNINTTSILKYNKVYLEEKYHNNDIVDYTETDQVKKLEENFNDIIDQYKLEQNPYIIKQLEIKIRKLASELNKYNIAISVEEMLNNINREKKLRKTISIT